jgi:hypothetical protein
VLRCLHVTWILDLRVTRSLFFAVARQWNETTPEIADRRRISESLALIRNLTWNSAIHFEVCNDIAFARLDLWLWSVWIMKMDNGQKTITNRYPRQMSTWSATIFILCIGASSQCHYGYISTPEFTFRAPFHSSHMEMHLFYDQHSQETNRNGSFGRALT